MTFLSLTFLTGAVYFLALVMNVARKNTTLVALYLIQSLFVALTLVVLSRVHGAEGLLLAAALTLVVKVIGAPVFLLTMIRKYSAHFSAASYVSTPLTLLALAGITAFSYSFVVSTVLPLASPGVPLLIASIFAVFFLMINRKGALAQIVGVLALENGVVLLAALLGIEHSFALELVIAFDIAVWTSIAAAFLTMMYRQFGDIEEAAQKMTHLTEK